MPYFKHDGKRLAYTEFPPADPGREGRVVVLLHGLLLSQLMHQPLAEDLAARGNRVITLDLLGHGASDRPRDMWRYSMSTYGRQVVALLDHLEVDQAVVMGTSLGANASLEIAASSPQRLRGLVIEMPVLDNALLACAVAFTPLLVSLTFGEPAMKALARAARAVPRRLLPHYGNVALDLIRQEPGPGGAVLQGLFFGRIAPPRAERRTFTTPALILGHTRDPIHPFSDAGMLAKEMPDARLIEADSLLELRTSPERLTNEIAGFLDEVWKPRGARGGRAARKQAAPRRQPSPRKAAAPRGGTRRRAGGGRGAARD